MIPYRSIWLAAWIAVGSAGFWTAPAALWNWPEQPRPHELLGTVKSQFGNVLTITLDQDDALGDAKKGNTISVTISANTDVHTGDLYLPGTQVVIHASREGIAWAALDVRERRPASAAKEPEPSPHMPAAHADPDLRNRFVMPPNNVLDYMLRYVAKEQADERLDGRPMQFRLDTDFGILLSQDKVEIVANGRVMPDTDAKFEKFLNDNSTVLAAAPATVVLNSIGGDLDAGIRMGRVIRQHGLLTSVMPNQSPDSTRYTQGCVSSCNFIFMGGNRRTLPPGALFVTHRFKPDLDPNAIDQTVRPLSSAEVADVAKAASEVSQDATGEIAKFLQMMGINSRFLAVMGEIPNAAPAYLPADLLRELNITTSYITTEWTVTPGKEIKGFELDGTTAKHSKPNLVDRISLVCDNQRLRMLVYYMADQGDIFSYFSDWDGKMESLVRRMTGMSLDEPYEGKKPYEQYERIEFRRPDLKILGSTAAGHVVIEVPMSSSVERLWKQLRTLEVWLDIGRSNPANLTGVNHPSAIVRFTTDLQAGREQIDGFIQNCR